MNEALEGLVRNEVEALGFDLVEFRRGGTVRRPLLDVRIDRTDDSKITVDDCARVSKAIEPKLDASGLAGVDYILEVSSPGVERPLRHAADWRRFVGRRATVVSPALGGKIEVEVMGVDGAEGAETAFMRDDRGVEHRVPLSGIREARLVFRWKK